MIYRTPADRPEETNPMNEQEMAVRQWRMSLTAVTVIACVISGASMTSCMYHDRQATEAARLNADGRASAHGLSPSRWRAVN